MSILVFVLCSFITTIIYYLGGLDNALQMLLMVMILDILTGIAKAIYNKQFNVMIGIKGIIIKFGYLIIVSVSFMLDKFMESNGMVRGAVIYLFVFNQVLSILQNWTDMGIKIPTILTDLLNKFKKNTGGDDDEQDNRKDL